MKTPQLSWPRNRRATRMLLLASLFLLAPASQAEAEMVVGSQGSGAGQIASPRGVAVDRTAGRLFVSDRLNERVDVFDANTGAFVLAFGSGVADGVSKVPQVCTTTCFAGFAESGAGEFAVPRSIAVDNEAASPSFHDVYVYDSDNNRVQEFSPAGAFILTFGDGVNKTNGGDLCTAASGDTCGAGVSGVGEGQFNAGGGVAVGPGGVVYVADRIGSGAAAKSRVQKYSPEGAYLGQLLLEVEGGSGANTGIAVDASGNMYVTTTGVAGALRKYDSTGTLLWTRNSSANINSVTADTSGHVFIGDIKEVNAILEFDSAGNLLRVFYGKLGKFGNAVGLAPYEGPNGDIFAAERFGSEQVLQIDFPPPGALVYTAVGATFADGISNVKATLHAEINPEGKAATYRFEYVDQESFEADGWASAAVVKTTESAPVGSDFNLHPATAEVTGLTPETTYHLRAVATNADAPSGNPGPETTFETKPPLVFGSIWSTSVGTEAAALHGEIDPVGIAATGYFEYVDQATWEASGFEEALEAPAVGSGASPLDFGAGEGFVTRSTVVGGLEPGTTYHYRLIGNDHCKPLEPTVVCRFESPEATLTTFFPAAPSTTSCPANAEFRTGAAGYLADCRGYEMVTPVDKNGIDIETAFNISGYPANLDQSALDGQMMTYSAARAFANPIGAPYSSQFLAQRTGTGWGNESISPPREGPTLFTTNGLDYQFKAFTPDLCLGWPLQDTAKPLLAPGAVAGFPNLYRRDNCGAGIGTYEAITSVPPPNIEPVKFFPELQSIASGGSTTFYSVPDKLTANAEEGVAQVYEYKEGGQLTLVCVRPDDSAADTDCTLGTPSAFGVERDARVSSAASADGSVVYWSEAASGGRALYARVDADETIPVASGGAEFWFASSDGSKALFRVGEQLAEFDLEDEASSLIAGGVRGVAGGSQDLSKFYFVSTANLAAGGTVGRLNFYLRDGATTRFIAELPSLDVQGNRPSPVAGRPTLRTSRITPDGDQITFMSTAPLTGYDNTDAANGKADAEVFLYDATANGGAGQLSCISCNPTGARPVGQVWAAHGSGGLQVSGTLNPWENQLYAPRVISDDGSRVFFNSFDALVARDTNGRQDVYEWEAPGAGDCTEGGQGFQVQARGCITLVSSGQSPRNSEFDDASASGDDVFFKTASSLWGGDPGLVDIYDARVGGGFPDPPPPPAECEGEACQNPQPAPEALSPSSEVAGPGNPVQPAKAKPKKCPKGKHKVKKKGKVRCVKNHKRKHNRAGRSAK